MGTYYGINLRASSTFVTDGTGETYTLASDGGSTTVRGGLTFTWAGTSISGQDRDRNNALDRRLAGLIYQANGGAVSTLTITLPEGAGTYNVWVAIGDDSSAHTNMKLVIKDNTTTVATIGPVNMSTNSRWYDATATERTSTTWPTNAKGGASEASGALSLSFSSSTMVLEFGNTTGASLTPIAHIGFEQTSAGGGGGKPASTRAGAMGVI